MHFQFFTSKPSFPLELSIGGYGKGYVGKRYTDDLEMNGLSWTRNGKKQTIISIDSLYAGNLSQKLDSNVEILSSHTHFAPMIDFKKPRLGNSSKVALNCWIKTFREKYMETADIDSICYYKTRVNIPIYRRFDHYGSVLGLFINPHIGMVPNSKEPIDNSLNVYTFCQGKKVKFCLVWHCCHPVSRRDRNTYSSDFIDIIRKTLRLRFGEIPVIFANGPSGDIRPNIIEKRIKLFSNNLLNKKFSNPNEKSEKYVDKVYETAINKMTLKKRFSNLEPKIKKTKVLVEGYRKLNITSIFFSKNLGFCLLPFEVSHRYHKICQNKNILIISCVNDVLGYLPHKTQLRYGGYEVDSSRISMGLKRRVFLPESELIKCL